MTARTRQPITQVGQIILRRPVTPQSPRDDLFQTALLRGHDVDKVLAATRAQLVALLWAVTP